LGSPSRAPSLIAKLDDLICGRGHVAGKLDRSLMFYSGEPRHDRIGGALQEPATGVARGRGRAPMSVAPTTAPSICARVCRPLPAGGRTKGTGGKDGLDGSLHERAPCVRRGLRDLRARSAATRHRYAAGPAAAPAFPSQSFALSRLSRRRGGRELYGQSFEHRLAPVVDADRARRRGRANFLLILGTSSNLHVHRVAATRTPRYRRSR
jgi:hypothetical protein